MNRYQKAQAAASKARKEAKKAAKIEALYNNEASNERRFPENVRVIVHGETDYIEYVYSKEDLEDTKILSKSQMGDLAGFIGYKLDRPDLGSKTLMNVMSKEEHHELGICILTYVANTQAIASATLVKCPVMHYVAARSNINNICGYSLRIWGIASFEHLRVHAQVELMSIVGKPQTQVILKKAYLNNEYHTSSMWYTVLNMLFGGNKKATKFEVDVADIRNPIQEEVKVEVPIQEEVKPASGWHYVMAEEHKKHISEALTGMRYKTKSREGIEWHYVDGKKEWL